MTNQKSPAPRVKHQTGICIKAGWKGNQPALVENFSESGAYLFTKEKLLPTTEVLIYLSLPLAGKNRLCMVSGKIVRAVETAGKSAFGYGIQFFDLAPHALKTMRRFISQSLVNTQKR